MRAARKPVWVSLPVDHESQIPRLFDGDSYVVRLLDGTELWAVYVVHHGAAFFPCDDEGNKLGEAVEVAAVCVSGYGPGFGPSCPKAGEGPRVHLVVASPSLVKIINESQRRARELLGSHFGAAS